MQMNGSQLLPVDRETAWQALNDPDQLKSALAGCERFERREDGSFAVVMTASVGPVKAKFNSVVTLSELKPPESYTLQFDGQGGVAGFGRGQAKVALVEEVEEQTVHTRLNYSVDAQVGGKLAQIGQRLIDATAKKLSDDFFAKFSSQLSLQNSAQHSSQLSSQNIAQNPIHDETTHHSEQQDRAFLTASQLSQRSNMSNKGASGSSSQLPITLTIGLICFLVTLGALGGR
jgi:uncharacterized protein